MISPRGESTAYYVACTVSQASNRQVPIRVMNPSNCAIEFAANQTLAEFTPVSEFLLHPPTTHLLEFAQHWKNLQDLILTQ